MGNSSQIIKLDLDEEIIEENLDLDEIYDDMDIKGHPSDEHVKVDKDYFKADFLIRRGIGPLCSESMLLDALNKLHIRTVFVPHGDTKKDLIFHEVETIDQRNLLHTACIYGNHFAVRYLINHGALVNKRDNSGNTCLYDTLEIFLEIRAAKTQEKSSVQLDQYREIIKDLIMNGADLNLLDSFKNQQPIDLVKDNFEIRNFLYNTFCNSLRSQSIINVCLNQDSVCFTILKNSGYKTVTLPFLKCDIDLIEGLLRVHFDYQKPRELMDRQLVFTNDNANLNDNSFNITTRPKTR